MKEKRSWIGLVLAVSGLILMSLGFFSLVALGYGLAFFVLGVIIFLNKNEDKIEQIAERR